MNPEETQIPMPSVPEESTQTKAPTEDKAVTTQETKTAEESEKDRNWKAMRESQETLRQQIEAERQERLKLEQQLAAASKPEEDPTSEYDGSDWATVDQSKALAEKIAREQAHKVLAEERAKEEEIKKQREIALAPQRLKEKFPDYESIITPENVRKLKELDPESASGLSQISDPYTQAVMAYKAISQTIPEVIESRQATKQLEENKNQPQSLSAASGGSPLSQAQAFENGLTPELKKQLYAEMVACAKRS